MLIVRVPIILTFLFALCPIVCAESIKLGIIVPLTGSASLMGDSLTGVVKLAHLKNVTPVFEDDRCEAKMAISAYTKLRIEGVRTFYMACSGSILAVAPLAKRNGDLILTTYAGSAQIRKTGDEVIRLNPDAISVAEGMSRLLSKDLLPTAVLYEEQDYAQSLVERLRQLLGSGVVGTVSYRPEAPSFSTEILRIKKIRPKSITLIPVGDGAARTILKQMSQSKLGIPVIGDVNLCDYPFRPSEFNLRGHCVSARFSGAAYEEFLRKYSEAVGHLPAYPFYDAMALDLLLKLEIISASHSNTDQIKSELLKGFVGRFASYKLSYSGEAENGGDYLTRVDF